MDPEDNTPNISQKLNDITDRVDSLEYVLNKKLGSSSASIQGSFINSVNFKTGVSGWQLSPDGNFEGNNGNFRGDITGATGTFTGTVTVGSLNIPDSTTANSMHVDSSGNTWWGANVATGYTGANAYVLNTGAASFKNVYIGGSAIQYIATDHGIFSFGDGSDGAATLDGSATPSGMTKSGSDYTMTRDVYYTDMTLSTGTTLNPAGYRIFGTGTCTLNGTAVIKRNGNNGTNGSGTTAGTGGAALADGYLKGSAAGGNGGTETPNVSPQAGSNTTNSIGTSGATGGDGGAGSGAGGQTGGVAGTATTSNVKLISNWHLATLLDVGSTGATVKFDNSAGSGGGGGGGQGTDNFPGGGGGGGSAGGIIAIYFRSIVIGASASIIANGGNGGNGGNAAGTNNGGGGGGGGGNGGQIILIYNILTNSGSITCTKGTKGTGGTKTGTGVAGSNGADGTNGTIRQFLLSQ